MSDVKGCGSEFRQAVKKSIDRLEAESKATIKAYEIVGWLIETTDELDLHYDATQEMLVNRGFIKTEKYDENVHGEMECEPGDDINVPTEGGLRMLDYYVRCEK